MIVAGLYDSIAPDVWKEYWQVDVLPVADGRAALKYLAPYVFRVAISDNRIESVSPTQVTYRYTPTGTKRSRTKTVTGEAFTRSFLQHALPGHFQKVRHYGLLSSNSGIHFDMVRLLVWFYLGWVYWLGSGYAPLEPPPKRPVARCMQCGGRLRLLCVTYFPCVLVEHSTKYLDSG